ncbi:MAG: DUF6653 family protein [Pseudomonadota bacterium]
MADLYRGAERLMGMSDAVWARHANPWSCYTRFTVLPLLVLAIWSRVWVGPWAWLFVACVLAWNWLNPRVFSPPASLDNWASRGVLGERIWINRRDDVRAHHKRWAVVLTVLSVPGVVFLGLGLWQLRLDWTVFGMVLAVLPKVWFVDRMVWLYQDWLADQGKELGDV